MAFINKHDTNGTKGLLAKGELGYDDYSAGGDTGRVYVGNGSANIAMAKKAEVTTVEGKVDTHTARADNPHSVTKTQVGLGSVQNVDTTNASNIASGTLANARLANSGVTAGTYKSVTVDGKGIVTGGTNPTTISGYGITDAYTKAELNAGQLDNRYYTETEVNAALALKVDDTEIASVNLLRADKYLAAQNIASMVYTSGDLTKIQYRNATDVDYEVLNYTIGNLTSINHYTSGVLRGTTTLSYSSGNLVSAIFVGV